MNNFNLSYILPPEMWDLIFKKLSNIRELEKIKLLSGYFNGIIQNNNILKWKIFLEFHNKTSLSPLEQFMWGCRRADLDFLKWHSKKFNLTVEEIRSKNVKVLREVCKRKHRDKLSFKIFKWIMEKYELGFGDVIINNHYDALQYASRYGHSDIVKWLFKKFDIISLISHEEIDNNDMIVILEDACIYGHLKLAKWINRKITPSISIKATDMRDPFCFTCGKGHLKTAKWMIETFKITSNILEDLWEYVLTNICDKGHLNALKWFVEIFNLKKENIIGGENYPIYQACLKGHLEILKWLIKTFNLSREDVMEDNAWIFHYTTRGSRANFGLPSFDPFSTSKSRLEILKLLYNIYGISDEDLLQNNNYALEAACENGDLEMVKWLVETFNFKNPFDPERPVQEYYGALLEVACSWGHTAIGRYLADRFNLTKKILKESKSAFEYSYYALRIAIVDGHLETVKFMMERFNFNTLEDFEYIRDSYYSCGIRFPEISNYLLEVYSKVVPEEKLKYMK